jgi:hypothetical protein
MPRSMVGLLAAVGATMFALAPSAHGVLFLLTIATAAVATGLATYGALCPVATGLAACLAFAPSKKTFHFYHGSKLVHREFPDCYNLPPSEASGLLQRFAACVSGLASGLALAIRPSGLAEVSRVNGAYRNAVWDG